MKKIISFAFLFLFWSIFWNVKHVYADESIHKYDVTLTAGKNGTMHIQEQIDYDFSTNSRHGIYRTIPLVSQVGSLYRVIGIHVLQVTRDGQDENYAVSQQDQEFQIKIGDPNTTISGQHNYAITYDVQNGIGSNYTDHDEIYWNVTGNDWSVPIDSASIVLQTDFGTVPGKTICYTGLAGSSQHDCEVNTTATSKIVSTTSPLGINEGLTIVTAFPPNTFPKSILVTDKPSTGPSGKQTLLIIAATYFFLNIILAPLVFYLYKKHKHKDRFGPVTVNFDIPKDPDGIRILPAEAGTIDTMQLDKNDLTATIFDLANRKYIRIEEAGKDGGILGIGEKPDYRLIKLKNFEELSKFERTLTTAIFHGSKSVLVNEIQLQFIDFDDLRKANFDSLVKKGFYTKDPGSQMKGLLTLGIILTLTLNLILGPLVIYLSRKLNGRTQLGDEMDWKIDGLKLFLKSMSREYKWQAEKAYVVEDMIPYAMALGYIDEFMKQIKMLNPNFQPSWYTGGTPFYMIYPSFASSFSSNVVTTAPSSSSGFSGGFSGGGGGGGGGGSW